MKIRDYSRFWADRFNDELSEVFQNRIIANGTNCVNKLFSSFYNEKKKANNLEYLFDADNSATYVKNRLISYYDEKSPSHG